MSKAKTITNDALKEETQKDSLSNLAKEKKNKSKKYEYDCGVYYRFAHLGK